MIPPDNLEPDRVPPVREAPLRTAAALVLVQGAITVIIAVVDVVSLSSGRLAMGISVGIFFVLYGVGLIVCGRGLLTGRAFARGPVLLAELIWLGVAWSIRDHWGIALLIAVPSLVVLAGLLHPSSIQILESDRNRDG